MSIDVHPWKRLRQNLTVRPRDMDLVCGRGHGLRVTWSTEEAREVEVEEDGRGAGRCSYPGLKLVAPLVPS